MNFSCTQLLPNAEAYSIFEIKSLIKIPPNENLPLDAIKINTISLGSELHRGTPEQLLN
jgi:hypothetical protein